MLVPWKPHPFGGEWHTIFCTLCGILFHVELVEEKDLTKRLSGPMFVVLGETVGLFLWLSRTIWYPGTSVVLDSGVCVLKGILEMQQRGVYDGEVIKKRHYWLKHISGDTLVLHFRRNTVGDVDALQVMPNNSPSVFIVRKSRTMLKLSCWRTLPWPRWIITRWIVSSRFSVWLWQISFATVTTFRIYYRYCNQINDHNNCRHQLILIEDIWGMKHWSDYVHSFIIALTEANKRKSAHHFQKDVVYIPWPDFCRKLEFKLIQNNIDGIKCRLLLWSQNCVPGWPTISFKIFKTAAENGTVALRKRSKQSGYSRSTGEGNGSGPTSNSIRLRYCAKDVIQRILLTQNFSLYVAMVLVINIA